MARKAGIDGEAVIDAAAYLANTDGLAAVTLAAVASRLGIRPPSLYAHVAGLRGLRRQLAGRAVRELTAALRRAAGDGHGADRLMHVATAYRSWVLSNPGLYAALLPAPAAGSDPELEAALAEALEVVARPLVEMGAGPDDVVGLARTLRATLHGFVTLEQEGGFALLDDLDASFAVAVDVLIVGLTAHLGAKALSLPE